MAPPQRPLEWPASAYVAIEEGWPGWAGFRPTVCVAHRGQHARYQGACVSTPAREGIRSPRFRSERCERCGTAVVFVAEPGERRVRGPYDDRSGEVHRHPSEPEPAPIVVAVDCPHPHRRAVTAGVRAGRPAPPRPEREPSPESAELVGRIPKLRPGGRAYPPLARSDDLAPPGDRS